MAIEKYTSKVESIIGKLLTKQIPK